MLYTKNLIPGRFELGTTLSWPNRSMPKITLVRSFLGVAGKSSCTENDYALVQSCMFFFLQGNFHSVFGDFLFCCPKQVSLFNGMTVL